MKTSPQRRKQAQTKKVVAIIMNDYSRGYAIPVLDYCIGVRRGIVKCDGKVPHGLVSESDLSD